MDHWDTNSIDHHHHHHHRQDHPHPSFSSTLLDQIYRSIDSSSDVSMRKKQNSVEKILVNRRAVAGDSVSSKNLKNAEPVFFKHSSSSSSSESSGLSSSESDSFYRRTRSSRSPPEIRHPKPIRTTVQRLERPNDNNNNKGKSKALKMYSDLKKAKHPISPGGRLATFINSIFNTNKKPTKINNTTATSSTTCSSASSFSRSCLSKTPSSSEKSKRCVRFSPVNQENSTKRSGHNYKLYGDKEREIRVMEENRRVIEAAKELIRTYQKNKDVVKISVEEEEEEEEEDEDDDGASCASSDLFELDHLSVIGIDRYQEELPVYETTRFNTNRVISR